MSSVRKKANERNTTQTTSLSNSMRISLETTPNSKNKVWEFSCHKNGSSVPAVEGKKRNYPQYIFCYMKTEYQEPPDLLTNQKHERGTRQNKQKNRGWKKNPRRSRESPSRVSPDRRYSGSGLLRNNFSINVDINKANPFLLVSGAHRIRV